MPLGNLLEATDAQIREYYKHSSYKDRYTEEEFIETYQEDRKLAIKDSKTIEQYTSYTSLVERISSIITASNQEVRARFRGVCIFCDLEVPAPHIYTLQNNLRLSELTWHYIKKHRYFAMSEAFRFDPATACPVLGFQKRPGSLLDMQDNRFKEEKATATLDHETLAALNVHQESIDNRIQSIVNTAKATASNQVFVDGVHFTVQFNPQARVDKCQFCDHENKNGSSVSIQNDAREDSISISTLAMHEMALHRYYGDPTKTSSLNPRTVTLVLGLKTSNPI